MWCACMVFMCKGACVRTGRYVHICVCVCLCVFLYCAPPQKLRRGLLLKSERVDSCRLALHLTPQSPFLPLEPWDYRRGTMTIWHLLGFWWPKLWVLRLAWHMLYVLSCFWSPDVKDSCAHELTFTVEPRGIKGEPSLAFAAEAPRGILTDSFCSTKWRLRPTFIIV